MYMLTYKMMTTVAYLNEANSIMANKATDLSKVYELLRECDEIVKNMILPNEYYPTIENVPVPVPEPTKPVKIKKETPKQVPVPLVLKKKNPWIEFLQNYSIHHDIPYHKVMKIHDIKEKYEQFKKNTQYFEEMKKTPEPIAEPIAEPVLVPKKEKKPKNTKMSQSQIKRYTQMLNDRNKTEYHLFLDLLKKNGKTYEEVNKIYKNHRSNKSGMDIFVKWCEEKSEEELPTGQEDEYNDQCMKNVLKYLKL